MNISQSTRNHTTKFIKISHYCQFLHPSNSSIVDKKKK